LLARSAWPFSSEPAWGPMLMHASVRPGGAPHPGSASIIAQKDAIGLPLHGDIRVPVVQT
jgi:hypothetical protein